MGLTGTKEYYLMNCPYRVIANKDASHPSDFTLRSDLFYMEGIASSRKENVAVPNKNVTDFNFEPFHNTL